MKNNEPTNTPVEDEPKAVQFNWPKIRRNATLLLAAAGVGGLIVWALNSSSDEEETATTETPTE